MSLDREDLAARVLVAFASHHGESDPGDDAASFAVGWADALIARLRPATVAPVADAAPRPEWVRITGRNGCGGAITVGKVYRVMSWDSQGSPVVANDEGYDWYLCGDGAPRGDTNTGLPTWEPCAAPAPSAATDPRRTVGAVVWDEDSEYAVILSGDGQAQRPLHLDATTDPRWFALDDDEFVRWATREECERHGIPYVERGAAPSPAAAPDHPTAASFAARRGQGAVGDQHPAAYVPQVGDVVRTTEQPTTDKWDGTLVVLKDGFVMHGATPHIDAARTDETDGYGGHYLASKCVYLRPATAAERAAAGLPPITPDHPQGGQGAEAEGRVGDQRVAAGLDAPAKPAFDETSEREAAVDIAKDRGLDVAEEVGFVAGWLARARIAAKGGAS